MKEGVRMFGEEIPYERLVNNTSYEDRKKYWDIAIGLQATDNLKVSSYLKELVKDSLDNQYDYEVIEEKLKAYHLEKMDTTSRESEADLSALRINEILMMPDFRFSIGTLYAYHSLLFSNIPNFEYPVGKKRTYNIYKEQDVLNGESVAYTNYQSIDDTLQYDFNEEETKMNTYDDLSIEELVLQITQFISNIWQVHPFGEGNTRTIATFFMKYLQYFDIEVSNQPFKDHSNYFRDALVLANASRKVKTDKFLIMFVENAFLNKENQLDKEEMLQYIKDKTIK